MTAVRLPDRATLLVTGEEAEAFLQNLVTDDVEQIGAGEVRPGALLTPQGKILFDFLVGRIDGGFRLDVATSARAALLKRLQLYRLRSRIGLAEGDEAVGAVFDDAAPAGALADRRFPDGVFRLYGMAAEGLPEDAGDFARLRLSFGVAEAERDFPASDVFPHDVLLDQNGGVSFRKGCYVGQEVVSRMQHRGTARRRLMVLRAEGHLTPGSVLLAGSGTPPLGDVLSASGEIGIALVRLDRLADALAAGRALSADGVPVEAEVPAWAGYALPEASGAAEG
ncbi:folate-binding protein YgfZ [Aureimonas sp. AU4]|uniref:CAF17-like 4Fe-4S cluster assembly/insertion protein YgfZ n=1 Tax=Aureimonas sp. AU4 TaxID=1638163 RepID=UPI000782987B|nr:folate-binding protein YgfZ [Aureimonas sp. AU4]